MKKFIIHNLYIFLVIFTLGFFPFISYAQNSTLLTPEEVLWLKSRNNTVIVYPEKGFVPFSYQSASGIPQGLSIDFLEIISKKIGFKIQYLPSRPLYQILDDIKAGKGDIITSISSTKDREDSLLFTDDYISVSTVIVVRKDSGKNKELSLADLNGMKVAVRKDSALEKFIQINYPRVIVESLTEDEVSLQQVVLGEVDAAVMDIASLSFYLSKQVLNSVKVAGNVGYEYKLSFAVTKEKAMLQSILEKGLAQISKNDRQILIDKWVSLPNEAKKENTTWTYVKNIFAENYVFIFIISCLIVIIFLMGRHKHIHGHYFKKRHVETLKEDLEKLEHSNEILSQELEEIQKQEDQIRDKIDSLDN